MSGIVRQTDVHEDEPRVTMPTDAQLILRQVNDTLRSALNNLRPEHRHCSSIRPDEFSDLLHQIGRATACLYPLPPRLPVDPALENEALEFRRNLQNLRQFLPGLQVRLLAERSRLDSARTHLGAAAAWDQARNSAGD